MGELRISVTRQSNAPAKDHAHGNLPAQSNRRLTREMTCLRLFPRIESAPRLEKRVSWKGQADIACVAANLKRPLSRPKVSHVVAQTTSAFSLRGTPSQIKGHDRARAEPKRLRCTDSPARVDSHKVSPRTGKAAEAFGSRYERPEDELCCKGNA